MAKNDMMVKIGSWAFITGILIAIFIGIYAAWTIIDGGAANNFFYTDTGGGVAWILAIIGAIIGALAIMGKGTLTAKEVPGFLLAGIALLVMYAVFKGLAITPWLGALFEGISLSLAIFVAPAVGILSLFAIYAMGKDV